jgi:hypothetical protein
MFQLKPIHKESIPKALEKAERYRLLNEPWQAESICQDVLRADPENQEALVTLLLALTDQFDRGISEYGKQARGVVPRLRQEYDQAYYAGIICERQAKAQLHQGTPGSGVIAYHWLREAMSFYEKAEAIRPPGNDDAVIRWNTCARIIMQNPRLVRESEERVEPLME